MSDTFLLAQLQPFTLAGAGANIGDTTLVLSSMKDIDGVVLAMTNFGTIGFGTLEPGNGVQEEQISFSGITQNSNGTATLTGVKSVAMTRVAAVDYVVTNNITKTHAGGTIFVISNTVGFYDKLSSKADDETITGTWTFTTPNYPVMTSDSPFPTSTVQLATKAYVDYVGSTGTPDATDVAGGTKGKVYLSVAPNSATDPIAVGTNDPKLSTVSLATLTANQVAALVGTGTPNGTTGKYVTLDTATSTYQLIVNLSDSPTLGTSSTLYPSQKAVKTYVDTNLSLPFVQSTIFETAGRFFARVASGTNTFDTVGVLQDTTSTGSRYASINWEINNSMFVGSPVIHIALNCVTNGTDGMSWTFLGIDDPNSGFTSAAAVTAKHVGFKIIYTTGPVATLYATQADGSTENVSSALTTLATTDYVELTAKINGTTSVDYYWRKNGGAWSSATNLTSNLPTTSVSYWSFGTSNFATATQNKIRWEAATYKR